MITFRNKDEFDSKIEDFDGENTRLVTDFDGTLIQPGKTSWCVFREILGNEYTQAADRLFSIYSYFEAHPDSAAPDERLQLVRAWFQAHFNLFRETPLTQEHLNDPRLIGPLRTRKGIWDTLREADTSRIPTLVFSGGISQVIEMLIESEIGNTSSLDVLANKLCFCEQGKSSGVNKPIIHTLNKTDRDVGGLTENVQSRTHTIIFGDSISDSRMVTSAPNTLITIGFLTTPKRKQAKEFGEVFDVVVNSDDCDGGIGNLVLNKILKR